MKHTFKLSIDCGNAAFCEGDTPTQESAAEDEREYQAQQTEESEI